MTKKDIEQLKEKYHIENLYYIENCWKEINGYVYRCSHFSNIEEVFKEGGEIYILKNNHNRGFSVNPNKTMLSQNFEITENDINIIKESIISIEGLIDNTFARKHLNNIKNITDKFCH